MPWCAIVSIHHGAPAAALPAPSGAEHAVPNAWTVATPARSALTASRGYRKTWINIVEQREVGVKRRSTRTRWLLEVSPRRAFIRPLERTPVHLTGRPPRSFELRRAQRCREQPRMGVPSRQGGTHDSRHATTPVDERLARAGG